MVEKRYYTDRDILTGLINTYCNKQGITRAAFEREAGIGGRRLIGYLDGQSTTTTISAELGEKVANTLGVQSSDFSEVATISSGKLSEQVAESGMPLEEFATRMGMTKQQLINYMAKDTNPRCSQTTADFANALKCNICDITMDRY